MSNFVLPDSSSRLFSCVRLAWIKLGLAVLCVLGLACLSAQAEIRVTQRILVNTTTVNQTEVNATYKVQVINLGAAATNVTAVVNSFTSAATVVQGNLTFPNIPAGGTATSINTYTIQFNRGTQVNQNLIRFAFSAISTPVANAGPDQLITALNSFYAANVNSPGPFCCKLNGRDSYDPFGLPLTYAWSVVSAPEGSSATVLGTTQGFGLTPPTGVVANFVPDMPGDYVLQLIVNNGYQSSAPSYIRLSTNAVAPRADAGLSQTVQQNATVQLDGSHSVNPMNRPLTYAWSFVSSPAGAHPNLSNPNSPQPTFVPKVPGMYTLQLVVTDGALSSAPATVTYTTANTNTTSQQDGQGNDNSQGNEGGVAALNNPGNTPPHADAGPDLHIAFNSYGFLSANRSTDSDGDFLTYRWAVLSGPSGQPALDPVPNPNIFVPGTDFLDQAIYHIELFVSDGHSESISTLVVSGEVLQAGQGPNEPYETVLPAIATVDPPPTPGTVKLDGTLTQASDPIDAAYWNLRETPSGSTAQLNPNGMTATITPDENGLYIAQFYADNRGFTNYPTAVSFQKNGGPPVANPGSTQFGLWTAPTVHTLNGSASWDPDGRSLTYNWSLLSKPLGSNATLSSATAVSPTFTADVDGTYIFQLVVNNGLANSAPAVVSVISKDSTPPVAVDISVRHPWDTPCVSVTLQGNDPTLDPYMYGYQIDTLPQNGYFTDLGAGSTSSLFVFPPANYGDSGTNGIPADNPEGRSGAKTFCYVPFSSTFSGFDSFTYTIWDDGYPSGCFTAGNYCIAPKQSAPASVTIDIYAE